MNDNLQPTGQGESGGQFSHSPPPLYNHRAERLVPVGGRRIPETKRRGRLSRRKRLFVALNSILLCTVFFLLIGLGAHPSHSLSLIRSYYCYYYPFLAPLENRDDTAAVKLKDACFLEEI